jgi:CRISPR-associated protein Cas1
MLRHGHHVLRYSDDFAVPVTTHAAGERVLELIESALRELDLELNEDKSRIEPFDEGVDFLGQTVTARSQAGTTTYVSPLEATVYVTEPGSLIRSRGGWMRVMHRDRQLLSVPYDRVKQVVCTTPTTLTSPFLRRALDHDIEVVLTEEDGDFLGRLHGAGGPGVELRHKQHCLVCPRPVRAKQTGARSGPHRSRWRVNASRCCQMSTSRMAPPVVDESSRRAGM